MVAGDEVLVALVEAFDVLKVRDEVELAVWSAVALFARKDEIPYAVEPVQEAEHLESSWKDVIYVCDVSGERLDADCSVAVEAAVFLVAVQRGASSRDR